MTTSAGPAVLTIPAREMRPFDVVDEGRRVRTLVFGVFNFARRGEAPIMGRGVEAELGMMFAHVVEVEAGRTYWAPRWEDAEVVLHQADATVTIIRGAMPPPPCRCGCEVLELPHGS